MSTFLEEIGFKSFKKLKGVFYMKKIFNLLIIASILIAFSTLIFASGTIGVRDYIKDKFPLLFNFFLSSLEDLDSHEKEFIDLLLNLPKEEQQYYAKEVYYHGFSLALLEEVIKSYTYTNLGSAYRSAGDYPKAIEAYQQALQMDPDNPAAHLNLGVCYVDIGDKNSALDEYKILQELDIGLANRLFDPIKLKGWLD
ncbi:Photosystem I assembly protein Ycf3 [subsurface metagenome]